MSIIINDTGYGFHMFVDIVKSESTYQDFNDIKSFYKTKCRELEIKTKNIEVNEKYWEFYAKGIALVCQI